MPFNTDRPTTKLLFTAVKFATTGDIDDAGRLRTGQATAFFVERANGRRALVTAAHAIDNMSSGMIRLHLAIACQDGTRDLTGRAVEVTLSDFATRWRRHPSPNIDLCACDAEDFLAGKFAPNLVPLAIPFPQRLFATQQQLGAFAALEDVVMVGCPAGNFDQANHFPILRRGATASHPYTDFDALPEGLIDIATFRGSSGSPVVHLASWTLLGVVTSALILPHDGEMVTKSGRGSGAFDLVAKTEVPIHLGKYVKARELLPLLTLLD